ncbi:MAG TPA: helix-turn-helix domain-containing protein [Thermoanaerobaculia bacterium]|jgi:transcriptional regulator with XRE-family HTH domain
MLGHTVRDQRLKKGFTQAKLARLAGVSRRHLAALEKGANVSILVLQKVASVLDLTDIPLGNVHLRPGEAKGAVNMALLADTLREAREETMRAQSRLADIEGILGGNTTPLSGATSSGTAVVLTFPRMPIRYLDVRPAANAGPRTLRDQAEASRIETAGELRHGQPVDATKKEWIILPSSLVEEDEVVYRARGTELQDQGIEDGDILIVEMRPRGRAANGELVLATIGELVYVGRWWQKHGKKALMSNGLAEVTVGKTKRSLKVMAAVNQIIRAERTGA